MKMSNVFRPNRSMMQENSAVPMIAMRKHNVNIWLNIDRKCIIDLFTTKAGHRNGQRAF